MGSTFIKQKALNGGIIGLIRKEINGVPHYLIDAKFEPEIIIKFNLALLFKQHIQTFKQYTKGGVIKS